MTTAKICVICEKEFQAQRSDAVVCSSACRQKNWRKNKLPIHQSRTIELPADFLNCDKIAIIRADGTIEELKELSTIPSELRQVLENLTTQASPTNPPVKKTGAKNALKSVVEGAGGNCPQLAKQLEGSSCNKNEGCTYPKCIEKEVVAADKSPNPPMPVREKDEDAFAFAARKNEWKRFYGN